MSDNEFADFNFEENAASDLVDFNFEETHVFSEEPLGVRNENDKDSKILTPFDSMSSLGLFDDFGIEVEEDILSDSVFDEMEGNKLSESRLHLLAQQQGSYVDTLGKYITNILGRNTNAINRNLNIKRDKSLDKFSRYKNLVPSLCMFFVIAAETGTECMFNSEQDSKIVKKNKMKVTALYCSCLQLNSNDLDDNYRAEVMKHIPEKIQKRYRELGMHMRGVAPSKLDLDDVIGIVDSGLYDMLYQMAQREVGYRQREKIKGIGKSQAEKELKSEESRTYNTLQDLISNQEPAYRVEEIIDEVVKFSDGTSELHKYFVCGNCHEKSTSQNDFFSVHDPVGFNNMSDKVRELYTSLKYNTCEHCKSVNILTPEAYEAVKNYVQEIYSTLSQTLNISDDASGSNVNNMVDEFGFSVIRLNPDSLNNALKGCGITYTSCEVIDETNLNLEKFINVFEQKYTSYSDILKAYKSRNNKNVDTSLLSIYCNYVYSDLKLQDSTLEYYRIVAEAISTSKLFNHYCKRRADLNSNLAKLHALKYELKKIENVYMMVSTNNYSYVQNRLDTGILQDNLIDLCKRLDVPCVADFIVKDGSSNKWKIGEGASELIRELIAKADKFDQDINKFRWEFEDLDNEREFITSNPHLFLLDVKPVKQIDVSPILFDCLGNQAHELIKQSMLASWKMKSAVILKYIYRKNKLYGNLHGTLVAYCNSHGSQQLLKIKKSLLMGGSGEGEWDVTEKDANKHLMSKIAWEMLKEGYSLEEMQVEQKTVSELDERVNDFDDLLSSDEDSKSTKGSLHSSFSSVYQNSLQFCQFLASASNRCSAFIRDLFSVVDMLYNALAEKNIFKFAKIAQGLDICKVILATPESAIREILVVVDSPKELDKFKKSIEWSFGLMAISGFIDFIVSMQSLIERNIGDDRILNFRSDMLIAGFSSKEIMEATDSGLAHNYSSPIILNKKSGETIGDYLIRLEMDGAENVGLPKEYEDFFKPEKVALVEYMCRLVPYLFNESVSEVSVTLFIFGLYLHELNKQNLTISGAILGTRTENIKTQITDFRDLNSISLEEGIGMQSDLKEGHSNVEPQIVQSFLNLDSVISKYFDSYDSAKEAINWSNIKFTDLIKSAEEVSLNHLQKWAVSGSKVPEQVISRMNEESENWFKIQYDCLLNTRMYIKYTTLLDIEQSNIPFDDKIVMLERPDVYVQLCSEVGIDDDDDKLLRSQEMQQKSLQFTENFISELPHNCKELFGRYLTLILDKTNRWSVWDDIETKIWI